MREQLWYSVCTDLELLDLRKWVESVKILLETCRQATNKRGLWIRISYTSLQISLWMKETKKSNVTG